MADRKRRSADDGGDDDRTRRGRDEFNADDADTGVGDVDDDGLVDDVDDPLDDADGDSQAVPRRRSRATSPVAVARTPTAARAKAGDDRAGILVRVVRFVREVVAELQKVIWPTRKELLTYTAVVVVFVAVMMTLVALLDLGFAKGMFFVFGGGGAAN